VVPLMYPIRRRRFAAIQHSWGLAGLFFGEAPLVGLLPRLAPEIWVLAAAGLDGGRRQIPVIGPHGPANLVPRSKFEPRFLAAVCQVPADLTREGGRFHHVISGPLF